ncbi:ABC-2 type transport system permease protein [Altererythrobacter atlanticus]|uniref:Transport permease protein n=1 Tax=Croceibacterium atlanticum TaxID=1267766 RepID=A0A0F7KWZ4_9SPHN|nr:ABC transporter permease [Croceibacterium atlanticum]AKH44194.1 Inner membrane transport permease YbhR [Croceibacterium atlanticum]MBB5732505.1 ABC-2 type transport system permease protein [Croceibacterium atlanticum]
MQRLKAMVVKEIWALLRDPKARIVLIAPPLMQLFIFTFATTLDVTNVDIAVLDRSQGVHAAELVQRVAGSPNFRKVVHVHSAQELDAAIDRQDVIAALVIDNGFDTALERGQQARLGIVLDGRRSNAAQIVNGYINQIVSDMNLENVPQLRGGGAVVTNWFNPTLDFKWFTLPGLIVIISSIAGIAVTSQTVSREREMGTFDQLLVSPLRVHEILAGKVVPPFLVGLVNGILFLVVAQIVFGVPYTGSVLLFFPALSLYLLSLIGIGLFVSSMSMTQQQSFLGAFAVTVPLMLLSGYAAPIENMPVWLQPVTYLNPARYFLILMQGLFLKDMPVSAVLQQLWPLAVISIITLTAAGRLFRARME